VAPAFSSRSTATVSSQPAVASSRILWATGDQLRTVVLSPASSRTRAASASTSAARSIILVGMHP
jgi:hypothetical protein